MSQNLRLLVYRAAGQMLHVSGKVNVVDRHLVIQTIENSWEMRVFDGSLNTLRGPILVGKWLYALLTLARVGGIGRRSEKEASRVFRTFFLE